jgi:hypothetical protein
MKQFSLPSHNSYDLFEVITNCLDALLKILQLHFVDESVLKRDVVSHKIEEKFLCVSFSKINTLRKKNI